MRRRKTILLTTLCLISSVSVAQAQSPEKRELIAEFRKLTGANVVSRSINFSADGIRKILLPIVEDDKELNEAQKQNLLKSVDEGTDRIDKAAHQFLDNQTEIAKLEEEVINKIYDTSFTEPELKELITFYRTPTGQKAAAFLRGLSNRVQTEFGPVIQQRLQSLIQPMLQTEMEQLKLKVKEAKVKRAN
jgi:hypothetical protein